MALAQNQTCATMENNRRPRDSPHNYRHLASDKGVKNLHLKKDGLWTSGAYKVTYSHGQWN